MFDSYVEYQFNALITVVRRNQSIDLLSVCIFANYLHRKFLITMLRYIYILSIRKSDQKEQKQKNEKKNIPLSFVQHDAN